MNLNTILNEKSKFSIEEIDYLINNTNNQIDYMTLNYIEQQMVKKQGKEFIQQSSNKIQFIMSILLREDIDELFEFYSFCFDEYMKNCKNNKKAIPGFNITFITLIHMSYKILRKLK